jgi:hypothetical protein
VLVGVGILGDPTYIPSIIKKMDEPELARVAGEAFSMITGVDLAYEDFEGEQPEDFEGDQRGQTRLIMLPLRCRENVDAS